MVATSFAVSVFDIACIRIGVRNSTRYCMTSEVLITILRKFRGVDSGVGGNSNNRADLKIFSATYFPLSHFFVLFYLVHFMQRPRVPTHKPSNINKFRRMQVAWSHASIFRYVRQLGLHVLHYCRLRKMLFWLYCAYSQFWRLTL